jgi:hypothetical protein
MLIMRMTLPAMHISHANETHGKGRFSACRQYNARPCQFSTFNMPIARLRTHPILRHDLPAIRAQIWEHPDLWN